MSFTTLFPLGITWSLTTLKTESLGKMTSLKG
jgi:hypothetical protein